MAYELPESISLERLKLHCYRVSSAAEARGFHDIAANFDALAAQIKTEMDAREMANVAVSRAQGLVAVRLFDAHQSVGLLSRRAFDFADKKAKKAPYRNLFGTHKARDVQRWGADNTVEFILDAAAKAQDFPQLSNETAEMVSCSDSLKEADRRRDEAEREASRFEFVRAQRHAAVETAMDEAEAQILSSNPGRHDLVQAILSPNYMAANRRKAAARKAAAKKAAAKDGELTSKDQSPQ